MEFLERALTTTKDEVERYELAYLLSVTALSQSEYDIERACHYEHEGSHPGEVELEWSKLVGNLEAALRGADRFFELQSRVEHTKGFDALSLVYVPTRVSCIQTLAASRLGDLARARAGAARLSEDLPCSVQALVEFGHALHDAGFYGEARTSFEGATAIDAEHTAQWDEVPIACPSVHPEGSTVRFEPGIVPHGNMFVHWCSWAEYLMYRQIDTAHALGELDDAAAAQAFLELVADLRASDRHGVYTIIAAIEHDVEQLTAAR